MHSDSCRKAIVIEPAEAITLAGLLQRRVRLTPTETAYSYWSADANGWKAITWQELDAEISLWRAALAMERFDTGDRIALLLANGIEWVCMEQASLALGLVPVPLYNWDSADNIAYILADCDARLLVLETTDRARELAPQIERIPNLRTILALTGKADHGIANVDLIDRWLARGGPTGDSSATPTPDDLATLVYTSGTTGHPKGVMLSHRNILDNASGILKAVPPRPDDNFLSVLPLAHAYERTVGYYVPMMAGLPIAFARSPQTVAEDILVHRPSIMLVVPRVLERIHDAIRDDLARKSSGVQYIYRLALKAGWRRFEAQQAGRAIPLWSHLVQILFGSAVAGQVLGRLGGRLRVLVCGGAPLSAEVSREFLSLGIAVLQGYGMTEASPVISSNRVEDNIPESAGTPIAGCEIQIGQDGELLVRSQSVMLGYWRQPEKTRQTIDEQGWLHTGDIAEIRGGRIYVTGRLGDVVKLATGHKVPVAAVEEAILHDPLFHQAIVDAKGRRSVLAIAVVDGDHWRRLGAELGVDPDDPGALRKDTVRKAVLDRMARLTHALPPYCRPQDIVLDLEPWSVESGLLTPTLKPKRRNILFRYSERADAKKSA